MKQLASTFVLLALALGGKAQLLDNSPRLWDESATNEIRNIRYNSPNPVRLNYNAVQTYGVGMVDYAIGRGSFHASDRSGKVNNLGVHVGGLKHIGHVDLSGYIRYTNRQNRDQRWNSTLGLRADNPLTVGDSVKSHQTIEQFDMNATAAWTITPRWRAGLSLGLTTGNLSDQTDPRPETKTSILPITAGAEYQVNPYVAVGLSGGVRMLRSDLSHTIVEPLNNYQYFLMKGNGDYYRRSSADVGGYDREYKGTTWSGGLQVAWTPTEALSNYLQVDYAGGHENATDEGNLRFKGGDYHFDELRVSDRLSLRGSDRLLHNAIVAFAYNNGNVDWYDQRKEVDTEHGNRSYYNVLSKYRMHKNRTFDLQAEYRLDFLRHGAQDAYIDARAGLRNFNNKQLLSSVAVQKANVIDLRLAGGKMFRLKKVELGTMLYAGWRTVTGDDFADGSSYAGENIAAQYSLPAYQYAVSGRVLVGGHVYAQMPVAQKITAGFFTRVDSNICTDDGSYWEGYKNTSFTQVDCGVYLKF